MSENEKRDFFAGRIVSIDALRGFDMFWIIGGGALLATLDGIFGNSVTGFINWQLEHAEWEGFRFEDIIMPLFLFIVGAAMPFSFSKRLERGESKKSLYLHIIRRTLILFFLGMIAQGNLLDYDLSTFHIFSNTLQAIAVGYLVATVVMLNFKPLGQVIASAVFLLLFWALMMLVPVPGYGREILTPEGNLAIYIDKLVFGRFQDGTNYTWLLSGLGFAATTLMGVFGGQWLRTNRSGAVKVLGLAVGGGLCMLAGYLWGWWFPIIKHLWTSSFVLYSGGMCYVLLALFYLIIDVWGFQKWAFFFKVIGMNAIAVYMATMVFNFRMVGNIFLRGLSEELGVWNDFAQRLAALVVIWLILWWMYRKRSFIKI
jgi:predicted acyltransferase